jgi:hypothetical protein
VIKESGEKWSTSAEKEFIDYLVTLPGKPGWLGKKSPRQLLTGYIEHAKLRIKLGTWGSVDGKEVVKYAEEKLKSMGRKRG